MRLPPRHIPKSYLREFSEDPFDKRFRKTVTGNLTPLGLCCRIYWHFKHTDDRGEFIGALTAMMRDECPDILAELEKYAKRHR